MLFREHKGSIQKSMVTVREFSSKEELLDLLNFYVLPNIFVEGALTVEFGDLEFVNIGFDRRVAWWTQMVVVKDKGVIGFINGEIK